MALLKDRKAIAKNTVSFRMHQ